jgi:hypothetical protein
MTTFSSNKSLKKENTQPSQRLGLPVWQFALQYVYLLTRTTVFWLINLVNSCFNNKAVNLWRLLDIPAKLIVQPPNSVQYSVMYLVYTLVTDDDIPKKKNKISWRPVIFSQFLKSFF